MEGDIVTGGGDLETSGTQSVTRCKREKYTLDPHRKL